MTRPAAALALSGLILAASRLALPQQPQLSHFEYNIARQHEIKPHRRAIPTEGAQGGFNQLHLTLTISPAGDVISAEAGNNPLSAQFWPKVRDEVYGWKFTPFEAGGTSGHPVPAEIEEYVDLVPPERLPTKHLEPPPLRPSSVIAITLERSGCFGSCPAYAVTLANNGVIFNGHGFVIAEGRHTAPIDQNALRALAQQFLKSDFYSMEDKYVDNVTDCPTYQLSITIDGRSKQVMDYMGTWQGMPAIVTELEEDVDDLAQTSRWIGGTEGLVPALEAEHYNFKSYEAQVMLKQAAQRGLASVVQDLLEAGVPLNPLPAPKSKSSSEGFLLEHVGWLTAASNDPKTLGILIDAQLSHNDQTDKDLALANAARFGNLASVRALIDYGANPNADLSKLSVPDNSHVSISYSDSGTILLYAASSGDPEVVREILKYHPPLEARDKDGKTALFAASDWRNGREGSDPAECIRLLVQAGANVNTRNKDGDTPLHQASSIEAETELLKAGADVNARNNKGETPVFTSFNEEAIALYAKHGANLSLRDNEGKTALESLDSWQSSRADALKSAIASQDQSEATASPSQQSPAQPQ